MKNVRMSSAVLPRSDEASASSDAAAPDDAPTRERVARSILDHGPSTAAALADRLALTSAAVRRHLDQLVAAGTLVAREPRAHGTRGRGRPAKVFVLTDSGRDTFQQSYDDLAASALRFLNESGGPGAVAEFARKRTAEFEDRYRELVDAAEPGDRAQALATALTGDGFAASVHSAPVGDQICQHHCPVAHVAAEFPQLCEAETEAFARLLGRHVQRLATIAHGDGVCTTNVPAPDAITTTGGLATRETHDSTPNGRTSS